MSKYKATGKNCTLGVVYKLLDQEFKTFVDQIIQEKRNGHCLLRLLHLTDKTQIPTKLLEELLDTYSQKDHCFKINGHDLNLTLEDIVYITGLPINGKAVISSTSRDPGAFTRVFPSLDNNVQVSVLNLKTIVYDQTKDSNQRLIALLLIVIFCFITPVCDDYIIHSYLVQFVEKLDEVDGYAWGAALLSNIYCAIEKAIEKTKSIKGAKTVHANCWPLLVFFGIRIPRIGEALDFLIDVQEKKAPLLNECMEAMQKISVNKRDVYNHRVTSVFEDLKDEDIIWHPYNAKMLDDVMQLQLPFVTCLAPVICMNYVAYHRPLTHLKQFTGLEDYVGKSFEWEVPDIKLKQMSGNTNQDFEKIYAKWLTQWKDREPVLVYIKKSLKLDDAHSSPSRSQSSNRLLMNTPHHSSPSRSKSPHSSPSRSESHSLINLPTNSKSPVVGTADSRHNCLRFR